MLYVTTWRLALTLKPLIISNSFVVKDLIYFMNWSRFETSVTSVNDIFCILNIFYFPIVVQMSLFQFVI